MTLEERRGFVRVLLSSFFSPPTCCRFSVRVMDEPHRRKEGGERRTLKNIALPPSRWRRCLAGEEEEEERVFVANCPQHVRGEAIFSATMIISGGDYGDYNDTLYRALCQ